MALRVLVVEDDSSIGGSLVEALRAQGHHVYWHQTGRAGLSAATAEEPEVVLLDLGLPDLDGIEVCRRLRDALPAVLIIVITARDEEIDVVLGLDAGADDYITKPFRLAELLARLRAGERRLAERIGGTMSSGSLEIDSGARRASVDGRDLILRPKEFDLLSLLVAKSGRVVTRERIIDVVWDEHWHGSTKTLDVHIVSLRRKLADAGESSAHITTLRGVGYRFDPG